jgi:hypothetical protein
VGYAANVLGGSTGQFVYQTSANTTGFIRTGSIYVGNAAQANILNPANTATQQVGYAANVLGGSTGQFVYQTSANTTGFISTGSIYVGNAAQANIINPANTATQQVGFAVDILGGAANQIVYQVGANDTGFIAAPTTATTYLAWTGTNYTWSSPFTSGGTFANTITVKGLNETIYNWGTIGAGTYTPDVSSGTVHKMTLTGNVTINSFTNATTGSNITMIMTQDSTGTRTLSSTMKFAGAARVLSTPASSIDVISVFYDGTNYLASLSRGFA